LKPDSERLLRHLKAVSRERNWETSPEALAEVQAYVAEEFRSYGLNVLEEPFIFSGKSFCNVIARSALDSRAARLILGAHFDAVSGSPGADDNATGIAALLEVARLFRLSPVSSSGAVEFVAFNIEEYGMIGSRAYAEKFRRERASLLGMLSLEMIGYTSKTPGSQKMPLFLKPFYPDTGNFIGLVANLKSKKFLKEVEPIFKNVEGLPVETLTLPGKGWIFPDARLSDHSPFWDEGFPALLVTDTSFFRNPYYHTSGDRIETLDLDFLAKVTEAAARTVIHFASRRVNR
jgi:Zn-dependent M28 family amino/carboxypeptidase